MRCTRRSAASRLTPLSSRNSQFLTSRAALVNQSALRLWRCTAMLSLEFPTLWCCFARLRTVRRWPPFSRVIGADSVSGCSRRSSEGAQSARNRLKRRTGTSWRFTACGTLLEPGCASTRCLAMARAKDRPNGALDQANRSRTYLASDSGMVNIGAACF